MQFKVPQFLEIEDKIFGPFTFKQFVYLVGGGGLCFVLYKWLGLLVGIIPMAIIAAIALALAFYRPNNKPLINMAEAAFMYLINNRLYVWKRRKVKKSTSGQSTQKTSGEASLGMEQIVPKLGSSKLKDLAWSLDVLDLDNNDESR